MKFLTNFLFWREAITSSEIVWAREDVGIIKIPVKDSWGLEQ